QMRNEVPVVVGFHHAQLTLLASVTNPHALVMFKLIQAVECSVRSAPQVHPSVALYFVVVTLNPFSQCSRELGAFKQRKILVHFKPLLVRATKHSEED